MKKNHMIILVFLALLIGAGALVMRALSVDEKGKNLEKIIALQDSISVLWHKVDKKREKLYELQEELSESNGDLQELRDAYRSIDDSLRMLGDQLKNAKNGLEKGVDFEETLRMVREARENLHIILYKEEKVKNQAIRNLAGKNTSLNHRSRRLIAENERLNKQLGVKSQEIGELTDSLYHYQQLATTRLEENDGLKQQNREQELVINQLKKEVQNRDTIIDEQDKALEQGKRQRVALEREKAEVEQKWSSARTALNKLADDYFIATYKHGRKHEVPLDSDHTHKSKHVKEIEVRFGANDKLLDTDETVLVMVELFDAQNILVSPSYTKDVVVNDYKGKMKLTLEKPLKKGNYYFKVTYQGKKIHRHGFRIS